jgi:hypothetical protein
MSCCGERHKDENGRIAPVYPATQCVECAEKHISLASALAWEFGYAAPNRQRIIGELGAAALHLYKRWPSMAQMCRDARHIIQKRRESELDWNPLLMEIDRLVTKELKKTIAMEDSQ